MAVIPPWLNPPDIAGEYARGLQLGANIQDAQNRLAAENDRARMEMQLRAAQRADEHEKEQARIAATAAYHTAQTGLAQQRLEEAKARNDASLKSAAARAAAQMAYARDLQATGADGNPKYTFGEALYRNPLMSTPGAVVEAEKLDRDHWSQALDLRRQKQDQVAADATRALNLRQQRITDLENKQGKVGTIPVPYMRDDSGKIMPYGPAMNLPADSPIINSMLGTNAPPGTGTNYQARVPIPPMSAAVEPAEPDTRPPADGGSDQSPVISDQLPAVPPPAATVTGASTGPVTPQTQAEYDALAPGTLYIHPADGKVHRKKAS